MLVDEWSLNEFKAPDFSIVDDTVGDPYCFESDHVALKNNPDYHKLLRTICLLEAQRAKAIDDMEVLYQAQEKIVGDIGFDLHCFQTRKDHVPEDGLHRDQFLSLVASLSSLLA
ncbi:hypothetical protein ACOMHN_033476 [Nucella lapillus]